jgi:hypothetical protein
MSFRVKRTNCYEIGIKICDSNLQNKGIGTRALILLIEYLFYELKAVRIELDTMIENKRAQKVYERIGFVKTKTNYNNWTDQLGQLRSSVDFALDLDDYEKKVTGITSVNFNNINQTKHFGKSRVFFNCYIFYIKVRIKFNQWLNNHSTIYTDVVFTLLQ